MVTKLLRRTKKEKNMVTVTLPGTPTSWEKLGPTQTTMNAVYRWGMINPLGSHQLRSEGFKWVCMACRGLFKELEDAQTHPCDAEKRFRMTTGREIGAKAARKAKTTPKFKSKLSGIPRSVAAAPAMAAPKTKPVDTLAMAAEDFVARFQDLVAERNALLEANQGLKRQVEELRASTTLKIEQEVERKLS